MELPRDNVAAYVGDKWANFRPPEAPPIAVMEVDEAGAASEHELGTEEESQEPPADEVPKVAAKEKEDSPVGSGLTPAEISGILESIGAD